MINIVDEIRNAFPAGTPPGRPITGHRCDECDEVDRLMGGRTWPDVAHPASRYEGRVVCGACLRRRRRPRRVDDSYDTPSWLIDVDAYAEEGLLILPTEPDPRPSIRDWLRRLFSDGPGRR